METGENAAWRDRARTLLARRLRLTAPTRRLRFALAERELRRFAKGRSLSVLDAGCSDALFSERIAARHPSWQITAIDTDDDVLAIGAASVKAAGLTNVVLRSADLMEPLGETTYDAVVALECLPYVADDLLAVRNMTAVLAPGGLFLAAVPEKHWKPILPGSDEAWAGEHRHGYTADELHELLTQAGLTVTTVRPMSRWVARLGRELALRVDGRTVKVRAAMWPLLAALTWLESVGITLGAPGAFFVEARR